MSAIQAFFNSSSVSYQSPESVSLARGAHTLALSVNGNLLAGKPVLLNMFGSNVPPSRLARSSASLRRRAKRRSSRSAARRSLRRRTASEMPIGPRPSRLPSAIPPTASNVISLRRPSTSSMSCVLANISTNSSKSISPSPCIKRVTQRGEQRGSKKRESGPHEARENV